MIRTGYLRWEIDATERRCANDPYAREILLRARPSYRLVCVRGAARADAESVQERFARGRATYDEVLRANRPREETETAEVELRIPDVGPQVYRFNESDRLRQPAYWISKLRREADTFGAEVVRAAMQFPQLLIASRLVRLGYARLVAGEVLRVINGQSHPRPTEEHEPIRIELEPSTPGIPELVAAELVRDVVTNEEFQEFCRHDRVTVRNGDYLYRISRKTHAFIEVWDAKTKRGVDSLCVVFQDPGMPPSDEVVMKYLLARHQPDLLWSTGNRFGPPSGRFEEPAWRR